MRKMNKMILAALAAVFITASAFTYRSMQSLPSISLKNTDGETVDVSSYSKNGKITIVSFWATWCGPCIKELDAINENYEDWQDDYNVELIAVSIDDAKNSSKVKPLAAGRGWDYEILLDENQKLKLAMNVANPPTTFVVDTTGNVVYTHTSYKPGDEVELEDKLIELNKKKEEAKSEDKTGEKKEDKEEKSDDDEKKDDDKKQETPKKEEE